MIGDKYKYSEYKINGQYSTSLGCSVTATMGDSVSENENDGKLDTHISAATHKLKRELSPVLNNSSSKDSGNILPRLDEHTHYVKGLFVDIENKNGSMEEMMSQKFHKKILHQCLKVYTFFNLNITNLKNAGGGTSGNRKVRLFKCCNCYLRYQQNPSIQDKMCLRFIQDKENKDYFVYDPDNKFYSSCWELHPTKEKHLAFC